MFVSRAGKELSEEGAQALAFLRMNGSSDAADRVLEVKGYHAGTSDIAAFSDKFSPAQHAKDLMAAQGDAMAKRMGG
jgi:hypothetical protein